MGVTSDLIRRVWQHREGRGSIHVTDFGKTRLVHAERQAEIEPAIAREKLIKKWRREWKFPLIEADNPACLARLAGPLGPVVSGGGTAKRERKVAKPRVKHGATVDVGWEADVSAMLNQRRLTGRSIRLPYYRKWVESCRYALEASNRARTSLGFRSKPVARCPDQLSPQLSPSFSNPGSQRSTKAAKSIGVGSKPS